MRVTLAMLRILALLTVLFALVARAQVDDDSPGADPGDGDDAAETEAVEEIVVVGGRSGDPQRLDSAYEAALRQRILREIERLEALEDEYDWRRAERPGEESRIRWGYDPRDEYRARRESELYDLPLDDTRPAKIFSIGFGSGRRQPP